MSSVNDSPLIESFVCGIAATCLVNALLSDHVTHVKPEHLEEMFQKCNGAVVYEIEGKLISISRNYEITATCKDGTFVNKSFKR